MAILVVHQNRKGKYILSSAMLLITVNLLVYFIAASNVQGKGEYFFFITMAVLGIVLFYKDNRKLGWAFVGFSVGLGFTPSPL